MNPLTVVGVALAAIGVVIILRPFLGRASRAVSAALVVVAAVLLVIARRPAEATTDESKAVIREACRGAGRTLRNIAKLYESAPPEMFNIGAWGATTSMLANFEAVCMVDASFGNCLAASSSGPMVPGYAAAVRELADAYSDGRPCKDQQR